MRHWTLGHCCNRVRLPAPEGRGLHACHLSHLARSPLPFSHSLTSYHTRSALTRSDTSRIHLRSGFVLISILYTILIEVSGPVPTTDPLVARFAFCSVLISFRLFCLDSLLPFL